MSRFWMWNPPVSSVPTAVYSGASVAGGKNAGLTLSAALSVRRTSQLTEGTLTISVRSYTPLIDSEPATTFSGRSGEYSGHRQASIIAARYPPAECPQTPSRPAGAPKFAPLRYNHAEA